MITGNPVSPSVVPSLPPLFSYSSTCSRTHCRGLGMYSDIQFSSALSERRWNVRDGMETPTTGVSVRPRLIAVALVLLCITCSNLIAAVGIDRLWRLDWHYFGAGRNPHYSCGSAPTIWGKTGVKLGRLAVH